MPTSDFVEKEFISFIDKLNVYLLRTNKTIQYIKFQQPDIVEFSIWDNNNLSSESFTKIIPKKGVQNGVYTLYDAKR